MARVISLYSSGSICCAAPGEARRQSSAAASRSARRAAMGTGGAMREGAVKVCSVATGLRAPWSNLSGPGSG